MAALSTYLVTFLFATISWVSAVYEGPRGMYCAREDASYKLIMAFRPTDYEWKYRVAIGNFKLYGQTKNNTIAAIGDNQMKFLAFPLERRGRLSLRLPNTYQVEAFATSIGLDVEHLINMLYLPRDSGKSEIHMNTASIELIHLTYGACLQPVNHLFCRSVPGEGLSVALRSNATQMVVYNDGIPVKEFQSVADTVNYPFNISVLKREEKELDVLLSLMDNRTQVGQEDWWMTGKAMTLDLFRDTLTIHHGSWIYGFDSLYPTPSDIVLKACQS
ncbi:hypothetical protein Pmar_PMAR019778 [Perkinsus marinus ATCC 50983]|uniref:Uncharacterized protein n=2 Tax=Perkinsus marinus (strain ATCC 50983 / TXsc) TaxID=423536 RepID=C5KZ44_PERM5|nr:hypothetical protein Pmar_PMAR019778 [Perkinsus marinus ATCC 50983]EER10259.1 hypothetical protein Pmar_PMAR019778 [Perkinsus marinus ATCC 50983]|eukprot:XP_002778464.1 hypothetical protein Pmar_PMAR019778 [Perkinsus marinus ATCC 50983]